MDTKELLTALKSHLSAFKDNPSSETLIKWLNERSIDELAVLSQRTSIKAFCEALAWMSNDELRALTVELQKAYALSSNALNACTKSDQADLLRRRTVLLERWKMLSFGFSNPA